MWFIIFAEQKKVDMPDFSIQKMHWVFSQIKETESESGSEEVLLDSVKESSVRESSLNSSVNEL